MKKSSFAVTALLFAALSASAATAFAADTAPSPYSYELGVTQHREVYKETAPNGDKIMQQTANMVGVKGSVTRHITAEGKVKVTGEYAYGDANYTGALMGGNYGDLQLGGLGRTMFETTAVYTHSANAWQGVAVSAGLGYRRHVDNLQDAGEIGYKRTNERIYAIVGIERAFDAGSWIITPAAEYKHTLHSTQKSDLIGGIKNAQHGNGGELSVSFAQKGNGYPVTIRPFYRTWDIADSSVSQGFYEPKNKTSEAGIDLMWRF